MTNGRRVAVIVSGWPRVSETFAVNELLALRGAGMLAAVFATKDGDGTCRQPASVALDDVVEVLPAGAPTAQARHVADRLRGEAVDAVHGYFAHQPADVAERVGRLLDVPFGFSAHALDVRKIGRGELTGRARRAAAVVVCNDDVATTIEATGVQPVLVRHGVDLDTFRPRSRRTERRPTEVLAVGRLVEKKGFDVLLDALALIERPLRAAIVGDGPERDRLRALRGAVGLADVVELAGRRTHDDLAGRYARADIVVIPSVVDRRGDRDGLPNVLLEAMASGCAVVASDVAAMRSAVRDVPSPDGPATGVLVPPGDHRALARALVELIDDPARRAALGVAARAEATARFDVHRCGDHLCAVLGSSYG